MRLTTVQLHEVFLKSLSGLTLEVSPVKKRPLEVKAKAPLPSFLRVYLYNLTSPPGGRGSDEHKIQIIVPGQARGQYGSFDTSRSASIILAGYDSELEVFVLWDSNVYQKFGYSRNVQVKTGTLMRALSEGLATQRRRVSDGAPELVVAVAKSELGRGIEHRFDLSLERMLANADE